MTLFQGSCACLRCGCGACAYTYASLNAKTVYLQLFPALHQIGFANFFTSLVETVVVPQLDRGYSPGVCQRAAVTLSAASPSEMSCPVRKIVKPSQSCSVCTSVTFGVAGSWCLPGALGPNWDLSAKPGELPRLLSFSFTQSLSLPLLLLGLYLFTPYRPFIL